jgi:hypothetical protein
VNNRIRFALLFILAIAAVGLTTYGFHSVSYASDTGRMSHYQVTELTLTDEVERGDHGKLVDLSQSDEGETEDTSNVAPADSETASPASEVSGTNSRRTGGSAVERNSSDITPAAVTKPTPKKKPAPKKPAPPKKKKPAKKKGKACPT